MWTRVMLFKSINPPFCTFLSSLRPPQFQKKNLARLSRIVNSIWGNTTTTTTTNETEEGEEEEEEEEREETTETEAFEY